MIQVYHSNQMESLVDELVRQIQAPLSNPMQPELIVVQNPGMAHWLSQQIAGSTGIAANLEFPLPASFAWRIYQYWIPDLPDQTGFDRESLRWRSMSLLPDCMDTQVFAPLSHYLEDDQQGLRAYQLAGRIADLFDQYLVFRPEMLLAWEQNKTLGDSQHEAWQASLWREIVAVTEGEHRAALFHRFHELQWRNQPPVAALPERISVFGITALAPVYLHALQAMAQHTQVHLYLLNPCREYWSDIQDEKGQARRRGRWRQSGQEDVTALLDVGNPLLASMGQMGQVFVDQLLETDADDHDLFVPADENLLLGKLQQDILELQDRRLLDAEDPSRIAQTDLSIQVHSCHSPMREVQVLHDQLRQLFGHMPALQAREVVVMAPDMSLYAPYVQAVFAAAQDEQYIPWSLADMGAREDTTLLAALDQLLRLPGFRFEASKVLSLLEVPAVANRFGVDEEGLEHIRRWVADTAIRWGTDEDMRAALGLPAEAANTWDTGLARLFHGYALPVDAGLQDELLPYTDIEGNDAVYLGRLAALIEALQQWQDKLNTPAQPAVWVQRINQLLEDFFMPDVEQAPLLQEVRAVMDNMLQHCEISQLNSALSLNIVRAELEQALDNKYSGSRFLHGGVTFCNMVPMRSIPFSVVCLLGINDSDFPRTEQPLSFDLMAANPRRADRSRRMDDRYLFLEALLSARKVFYVSYVGHSVKDNSIKVPSVLLSELLDYLKGSFQPALADDLLWKLVTEHPLQPFNHTYFDASDERLFSFDRGWLTAANSQETQEQQPFIDSSLPIAEAAKEVELNDLIRLVLNPAEWFLSRCLGVAKTQEQGGLDDDEPFKLDGLTSYQLRSQVLEEVLQGKSAESFQPQAVAGGELPHGYAGDIAFENATDDLSELASRIQEYAATPMAPLEVDLHIGEYHLTGWLDQLTSRGLLGYRTAKLKPKDRMRLWLKHLVLCVLQQTGDVESVHLGIDKTQIFSRVDEPEEQLGQLLHAWQQGQQQPLPFFPGASLHWVEKENLEQAVKLWEKDFDSGLNNWFVQIAFRGSEPLLEPGFTEWAELLAAPLVLAGKPS